MKTRVYSILLCLGVLLSIFAVGAAAEEHGYSVNISARSTVFTKANKKNDSEQRAYVYVTDHNIVAADRLYISVWDSNNPTTGLNCTGEYRITGNSRNLMDYTVATTKDQPMYLRFFSQLYSVWVTGRWFS